MDGAGFISRFWYLTLPHMSRAITIVILIQTIFLLGIFAEIRVTTGGGPGYASTNIAFLVFRTGILSNDIGAGSAGGVVAVIIANIVAIFLMRAALFRERMTGRGTVPPTVSTLMDAETK